MMLAMPQPKLPHHDGHHVPAVSSPLVTFSSTSPLNLSTHTGRMRSSRPKLTLNTAVESSPFRSIGKSSSLRLDTLSAISPTVRNTFSNAYERNATPLTRPKLSIDPSVGSAEDFKEFPDQNSSRTPSNSSISSASTSSSLSLSLSSPEHTYKTPYELPKDVPSILVNSLVPRTKLLSMSNEPRRPLGMVKRVSFRDPLDEEIKTETYILAHSDIDSVECTRKTDVPESSENTPIARTVSISTGHFSPEPVGEQSQLPSGATGNVYSSPPPRKSRRGLHQSSPRRKSFPGTNFSTKRDSSSDEDSDDSYSQTPVAGRCKRRRDWTWTLDPLSDSKGVETQNEKQEESNASYDDDSMSISSRCTESSTN